MRNVGLLVLVGAALIFFGFFRKTEKKVESEVPEIQSEAFIENKVKAPIKPKEILAVTKTFEPPDRKTSADNEWAKKNDKKTSVESIKKILPPALK